MTPEQFKELQVFLYFIVGFLGLITGLLFRISISFPS